MRQFIEALIKNKITWFTSILAGSFTIILDTNDFGGNFNYEGLTILFFIIGATSFLASEVHSLQSLFEQKSKEVERYIRGQNRVIRKSIKANEGQLKISASKGTFLKVDAENALKYLANNINDYTKIYNIRVRPVNKLPKRMRKTGGIWRDAIARLVNDDQEVVIQEVVSEDYIEESLTLSALCQNEHCENMEYEFRSFEMNSKELQIRNFTLVESKHPKENGFIWELYWGWDVYKDGVTTFNTYYTTDENMTRDYFNRFRRMFDESKEITSS